MSIVTHLSAAERLIYTMVEVALSLWVLMSRKKNIFHF
jgi:hypothetical protein